MESVFIFILINKAYWGSSDIIRIAKVIHNINMIWKNKHLDK